MNAGDVTGCQERRFTDDRTLGGARRPTASERSLRIRRGGRGTLVGNRRGQSLIEFTLVMPFLLLVTTGLVAFGFALHNDLMLTNAVNTGAQLLAFSRGQTTDPCATAYSGVSNAAPSLASGVSLTYVINGSTYSTNSCPAGASNMVQGASAQVTATYPCVLSVFGETFTSCRLSAQLTEFIQ